MLKKIILSFLYSFPYIGIRLKELRLYRNYLYVEPGNFYSPIVSKTNIDLTSNFLFDYEVAIREIDLNVSAQFDLLNDLLKYYKEFPYSNKNRHQLLFSLENDYFSYLDAFYLYGIIRNFKPTNIIEIGSGFSSALMIDTNTLFFDNKINLTFIEPFPEERFNILVSQSVKYEFIKKTLQEIELNNFNILQSNDILFIDSSHVVKYNSDVAKIIFEILPILKKGVLIHFHDIFYPFEYPREWLIRSWNEAYFLKAFLMNNPNYEIVGWGSYMINKYHDWFSEYMPLFIKNGGGSMWLRKK